MAPRARASAPRPRGREAAGGAGARAPARRWFQRGLRDAVGEVSPAPGRKAMDVLDGDAAFWRLPLSPLGPHPPVPGTGSLRHPRGVLAPAFAHASPSPPPPSLSASPSIPSTAAAVARQLSQRRARPADALFCGGVGLGLDSRPERLSAVLRRLPADLRGSDGSVARQVAVGGAHPEWSPSSSTAYWRPSALQAGSSHKSSLRLCLSRCRAPR